MSTPCSGNEPNVTPTNTSPNNETSSSSMSTTANIAAGETRSSRELKIFKKVIRDPNRCAAFHEFLEQQFCAENLNFYLAVESFKEILDPQERCEKGRRIFERYFAMNSTEPVNIDNSTSKRIRETVESGTFPPDTYDVAQYQILHLLKYDCYPRYLRSSTTTQPPSFTDEELAADDEEKNGHSQPISLDNTNEFEAAAQQSQSATNAPAVSKEKPSKQYSMPAEMTSPVKKNSLSPTQLRRRCRPVEPKHCQLMIGDQFTTETVTLDDPTMSVRRWTQEMADTQGMDRMHVEVVDAETGSTIDPARQAIDALQSRALRLVPVVSFIIEFLPANFSFKNPASTPTKLVCIRARHSLSTGAVLRPLLSKYTIDPQVTKIVLNGTLEQVKRSCPVGQVSQKCLTVMSDTQYNDRVSAGKTCLPPRDPILSQQPSTIYEQNTFPFHQNGDISYCEIPTESERNKHHHGDAQNPAHQQKEFTLSIFNKFVRKASHAVSKSDPNPPSASNTDRMASGVYAPSPATGPLQGRPGNSLSGSTSQVNNSSSLSNSQGENKNRLSIFKNKNEKKKSESEVLKPRTDDVPTTSQVDTKGEKGATTTKEDGLETSGVRFPAIFSTKVGNDGANAAASSPSTSSSLAAVPSTSSCPPKTTPPPKVSPVPTPVTAPASVPPIPSIRSTTATTSSEAPVAAGNSGGGGGNPRESSWQTAAYV